MFTLMPGRGLAQIQKLTEFLQKKKKAEKQTPK